MRTALYRHYDIDNTLLYVGISLSAMNRLRGHKRTSNWYDNIAIVTIEYFDTRAEADAAETFAIQNEKPLYNIAKTTLSLRESELEAEVKELKKRIARDDAAYERGMDFNDAVRSYLESEITKWKTYARDMFHDFHDALHFLEAPLDVVDAKWAKWARLPDTEPRIYNFWHKLGKEANKQGSDLIESEVA